MDRDLDLVMITGAGASCPFGVNGTRLPMMQEWSNALVKKLRQVSNAYLLATGLQEGLAPEKFEEQLGRFLRQVTAFSLIKDLVTPSRDFQPQMTVSSIPTNFLETWHETAAFHLAEIVDKIHECLYELFADPAADLDMAAEHYGYLSQSLGLSNASRWVYATTNYDTIGEYIIRRQGGRPDWGEPNVGNPGGEGVLDVNRLIDGLPRYIPVLHLHGRVGWYRRVDAGGRIYSSAITRHQKGFGVPIVVLPDPDKDYETDAVIQTLWQQFEESLQRAKKVFILGHSLNDRSILRAIREHVDPIDRVAVTVLADATNLDAFDVSAGDVVARVHDELGTSAEVIPLRFGSSRESGRTGIEKWLDRLTRGNLN